MIEETLRAQAQVIADMLSVHDTDDFMRRLAARIDQDAGRSSRPRREAAPGTGPGGDAPGSWPPTAATAAPSSYRHPRHRMTRPAFRRLRRRPTPLVPVDPAARPAAVLDHVKRLCEAVVRADDSGRLMAAFDAHYDGAGARSFACLLYIVGRQEGALYWWRFAAGTGDPLAAHLLASYHAAVGTPPDARAWYGFARWLGFRVEQHIPDPAPLDHDLPHAPRGEVARGFMDDDRLPEALLR
jgi:hypothetical protein